MPQRMQHPAVVTDSGQLRQVVIELVMNAVEAIEGGSGSISVRSAGVEIDEEAVRRSEFGPAAIPAGNYVTLEVRDTGCGMDEETQSRIFDPFFYHEIPRARAGIGGRLRLRPQSWRRRASGEFSRPRAPRSACCFRRHAKATSTRMTD